MEVNYIFVHQIVITFKKKGARLDNVLNCKILLTC